MGGEKGPDYTFRYRSDTKDGVPQCYLDVFLPLSSSEEPLNVILYFHGGGLTVGNRKSYFPHWLHDRAVRSGYAFLNADYTLICPSSGHHVLDDIHELFTYLNERLNNDLRAAGASVTISPTSVLVSGSSAGGYCAYLAALHATPRPKGVLSLYGMGGDLLTPQYLSIKTEPFFMGREMLSPESFRDFLYPFDPNMQMISDSPLSYNSPQHPTMPGWPSNLRMPLCRLLLQEGVYLDYLTGQHEPSLSVQLRKLLLGEQRKRDPNSNTDSDIDSRPDSDSSMSMIKEDKEKVRGQDKLDHNHDNGSTNIMSQIQALIKPNHTRLFPQFLIDSSFPPTFILHGELDSAVRVQESENLVRLLNENGIKNTLRVVPGEEHSFDYARGAYEKHSEHFDEVFEFVHDIFN